jgi:hypothetical protein
MTPRQFRIARWTLLRFVAAVLLPIFAVPREPPPPPSPAKPDQAFVDRVGLVSPRFARAWAGALLVDPRFEPTPLAEVPGAPPGASSTRLEQAAPQQKDIDDWPRVVAVNRTVAGVALVNPVVRQQGFASKGGHVVGVTVVGADPALQDGVTPVSKYVVEDRYQRLGSDELVVDTELAKDLNLAVGDRIRLAVEHRGVRREGGLADLRSAKRSGVRP